MEKFLFVYSRTKRFDYRLIYTPNQSFIPDEVRWKFIDFVREVLNEDNVLNGEITEPRWGIYKYDSYLLVGIGVRNSMLGEYDSDYTGTKIRGFYGQIMNIAGTENVLLNTTIDYYRDIFVNKIVPIFDTKNESEINGITSDYEPNLPLSTISRIASVPLNTSDGITRIHSCTLGIQEFIASSLSHQKVNVVTALNNSRHAVDATLCKFNNITVVEMSEMRDIIFSEMDNESEKNKEGGTNKENKEKQQSETKFVNGSKTDRFIDKLLSAIEKFSEKFGIPSKTIVERLYRRIKLKEQNTSAKKMETRNDVVAEQPPQPIVFRKADRRNIDKLSKQYRDSSQTKSLNDTTDNLDLPPVEFVKKRDNE